MNVYTEIAKYFQDGNNYVVRHVFRTDEDQRRHTVFYMCNNEFQAETLVSALLR